MLLESLVDEDVLLQHIDEYTLYCHYLEFDPEIKLNYISPLREGDETPSFGIFTCKKPNREYFWKDSGYLGDSGDIFKLVKLLFGYTSQYEVLTRIMSDFGLGRTAAPREKIIKKSPIIRSSADIRIRTKSFSAVDLHWWNQWNISEDILKQYRVSSLYCYWLTPTQKVPIFTAGLSFVYRIYDRYQLYFPLKAKGMKFRNDLTESQVMGIEHLTYSSDTLLITKSYKDVMCLRSYGYDAVSPRSENTPMPEAFFKWAESKYSKILVLFDNDMKHRGEWYPYPKIYVPIETGCKDISDFTRDYSPQAAIELLKTIL
jgi:hypothetical protein